MIIYSIIQKSQLEGTLRIDAEYYQPEFIKLANLIDSKKSEELRNLTFWIKKGIFDLSPENYKEDGIPFIRTLEINNPLIDFSSTVFLNKEMHHIYKNTTLSTGDLVFTKIGANIGKVALLPSKFGSYNFSQNVAGAKIKHNLIQSGYLLVYLMSELGKFQINRAQMISGQSKLELEDLRRLKIVILGDKFQSEISNLILGVQVLKEQSIVLYQQAENLLLSELGLKNFKFEDDLYYEVNASEINERIDSDYYQPKYEQLISKLRNKKKIIQIAQRVTKLIKINPDANYKYIEIGDVNVSSGEVVFNIVKGKDLPVNAKMKINGNELIISKVRPTRGAVAIIPKEWKENFVASSAFSIFDSSLISKEYLQVVLKSIIGRLQLEKPTTGTSYPTVTDKDVENTYIPLLEKNIQQKIADLVKKSHEARKKSKELLEEAKRKVEEMIEKGGEINK